MLERNKKSNKKLSMSNKRNKKVIITDLAIEKVPLIKYKDLNSKQHKILQYLVKKVLYVSKTENDSNEVAITYKLAETPNIANLGIAFGNEHDVNPSSDTKSFHILCTCTECAVVILHNHPSTSHISLMDIGYFISNANIKIIVMVTNKGAVSYIVKLKSFKKRDAIELFNKAVSKYEKSKKLVDKQLATNSFLNKCKTAGIYYSNYKK